MVLVSDDVDGGEKQDVEKADETKVPLTESAVTVPNGVSQVTTEAKEKAMVRCRRNVSDYVISSKDNFSMRNVNACMLKTFNRMKKRWGFIIYQFLLPALQVPTVS